MTVYAYWDYACPFSYLGWHRIERLRRERSLRIRWRPLELRRLQATDGEAPSAEGLPVEAVEEELARVAAEESLPFALPRPLPDSHDALQAAEFALDVGRPVFERLHGALFRAVFVEGLDVGDRDRLLERAAVEGVDPEALGAALEDARYEAELDTALEEARRYGIEGTPTFLFERYMLVGAAPLAEMRRAAERAASPAGS